MIKYSGFQFPGGYDLKYRIIGDTVQTLAVELNSEDVAFGRMGSLLFLKGAVKSDVNPQGANWSMLSDSLVTDGEAPLVVYRCQAGVGLVGFRAPGPGRIHAISIQQSERVIVKRNSIICASEGLICDPVHVEGEDSNEVPTGIFVSLTGSSQVFTHGKGNLVDFTLAAEERMVVDGEMILAMEGDIDCLPRVVGVPGNSEPGSNLLLMQLKGPGRVILHSMQD